MPHDNSMPRVEGGKLTKPYPINAPGDVHKARVLPPPRGARAAAPKAPSKATAQPPAPEGPNESEQPQGGFDYVRKRNRMLKSISNRSSSRSAKRSSSRRA